MEDRVPFDFSRTEIRRMSRECGIDILTIYKTLNLQPDPLTQKFVDAVKNAPDLKAKAKAINAQNIHLGLPGRVSFKNGKIKLFLGKVDGKDVIFEIREINGQLVMGTKDYPPVPESIDEGIPGEMARAQSLSRARVSSGIPWGTHSGYKAILERIEVCETPAMIVEIYNTIPAEAKTERNIALSFLAIKFYQPKETSGGGRIKRTTCAFFYFRKSLADRLGGYPNRIIRELLNYNHHLWLISLRISRHFLIETQCYQQPLRVGSCV